MKRTFDQRISKNTIQCDSCGLVKGHCICGFDVEIKSKVTFWILTHENELTRTNNTARLIENAMNTTKTFLWSRTEEPKELLELMKTHQVYLIFSDEKEEEKKRVQVYEPSDKKTAFLILDGTWKEVRKILRKSEYLKDLPIITLNPVVKTTYDLRRNNDEGHLCTVEVAIELLKLVGDTREADHLNDYYKHYMTRYHDGKFEHKELKDD